MGKLRTGGVAGIAAAVVIALASDAPAAPNGPAEKSLERCQNAIRAEGVKYVQQMQKAIGVCLGKIAGEVLKKNSASVAAAVATCTTQFDKIARTDGKSIGDLFTAKAGARCEPAPANAHTLEDLLGQGFPGVAEPLRARRLNESCRRFGGLDVDSASAWIDCVKGAQDCAVYDAIGLQFPRAIEWLGELAGEMPPSPSRDAVLAAGAAIDGTPPDGVPDGGCSVEIPAPGCTAALFDRWPGQVVDDLRAALAAADWDAVACNYHPAASVIDDQGVLVGSQEIVAALMSLDDLFDGADPVVHDQVEHGNMVRVLFSLDGGWLLIADGTQTYVVRRGRIVQQTTHGLIEFTGPPPED